MIRIFCDFDGTVCLEDIGELFCKKYAKDFAEKNVSRLLSGEVTMQFWLKGLCDSIPSITEEEFYGFVDQFRIDDSFREFYEFCELKQIPIVVLSDGLDLYCKRVLSNAGLEKIQIYANSAKIFSSNGVSKLIVSFPYTDSECNICGNCKRNHMLNLSADEDIIVYIGDGFSDRCPVQFADYVFAKRHLIGFCQSKNITYFAFNNFSDVKKKLEEILQRKRIRHRQEAKMMRREVFMQG